MKALQTFVFFNSPQKGSFYFGQKYAAPRTNRRILLSSIAMASMADRLLAWGDADGNPFLEMWIIGN